MEIDSNKFIKIMSKNFNFSIMNTALGKGVKMDSFSAFIYCSVTGAGYLDDPLYPFTPKGLLKLFYNAFDYKFVTGLFDNTTLKNTPYNLLLVKPFLFDSDKIIIPVEFNSERELQLKLKKFFEEVEKPTDYIIQRIELSKKGSGMEPFLEYLICETMKRKNYIVENQIPLSHSTGSPDFGGYRINKCYNYFSNANIIELAMIRLGLQSLKKSKSQTTHLIVGEAKTSTTTIIKQLDKYIKTKLFNEGFEIYPSKKEACKPYINLFTINENEEITIIPRKSVEKLFDANKQKEYEEWLSNYIKYYLIANLTNDEFNDFYFYRNKKKISSIKDIIQFVNNLSYEDIIKKIKEVA